MAKQIDVYKEWLGVQETNRPLSYYQLLRLKKFEDDTAKIREHYRKMNAHVRKFAAGDFAQQSQDLLNELAKAMLCLTDARRKSEYDASGGRTQAADGKRRTLEEILLGQKVIDTDQLAKARNFAKAVGLELRDALVQQKIAKPEIVMPAYAESIGLPYIDLGEIELDPTWIVRVPANLARQHSCAPVLVDQKQLLMASTDVIDPHVEEELRLRLNMAVRTVLCTPAAIHAVIEKHYPRDAAAQAAEQASNALPPVVNAPAGSVAAPTGSTGPARALTPEEKKARLWKAILTFNFVGIALVVALSFAWMYPRNFPQLYKLSGFLAFSGVFLIAGAIAGVVWAASGSSRK